MKTYPQMVKAGKKTYNIFSTLIGHAAEVTILYAKQFPVDPLHINMPTEFAKIKTVKANVQFRTTDLYDPLNGQLFKDAVETVRISIQEGPSIQPTNQEIYLQHKNIIYKPVNIQTLSMMVVYTAQKYQEVK